jgi:hypothetical protein
MLTGLDSLHCEIACKHNKEYEKKTWKERLDYFNNLNLNDQSIYKQASNPIGLRAATEAYKATLRKESSGYMISLDATASGLQLLSLLVSCQDSWNLCGGNHNQCVDSYTVLYEAMDIGNKFSRKDIKKAIMTSLYGSESIPNNLFGEDVNIFYDTLETMIPGAWNLNIDLQDLWTLQVKNSYYNWILPDNFHCYIDTPSSTEIPFTFLGEKHSVKKSIPTRPKFHKGLGPNIVHSIDAYIVREMFRRCSFNKDTIIKISGCLDHSGTEGKHKDMVKLLWNHYKKSGMLSSRILDYIYPDTVGLVDKKTIVELLQSFPNQPFDLVTIHDNFKCHPNYGNDVRKQYNIILAEINESNLLQFIVTNILNKKIPVRKDGKIRKDNILNSNYALS